MHSRKNGFTLVELLVVIGIIAVLVGILLPALMKARNVARGTACMSNMRQFGAAVMLYINENRGHYPAGIWDPSAGATGNYAFRGRDLILGKYLNNSLDIAQCPADPWEDDAEEHLSYMLNEWLIHPVPPHFGTPPQVLSPKHSSIRKASRVVVMTDLWAPGVTSGDVNNWPHFHGFLFVVLVNRMGWKSFDRCHGKGANWLFADNHVEFLNAKVSAPPTRFNWPAHDITLLWMDKKLE